MAQTLIERLAEFTVDAGAAPLPGAVLTESKRLILDALGCAVASVGDEGAQRGIAYGRMLGAGSTEATILGAAGKTSPFGATFANAELINALDQDPILPPGHVTPFVVPGVFALGESLRVPGSRLAAAVAVAHEISFRMGKATDYLRDIVDGVVTIPDVIGYSATLFGGTAAIGLVKQCPRPVVAHALGIMGSTAPANSQRSWIQHAPPTTIKYQLAGGMALSAMTAAHMAELGHRGDIRILDDREYGYPRFIGTRRWEPDNVTAGLGTDWLFPARQSYKPYPHCRILHSLLDALTDLVERNDIRPDEIDAIHARGESFVMQPLWLNNTIEDVRDAQFSMAHGIALGAQRIPPGKAWQSPEVVFSDSVMKLMDKVTYEPHPGYADALAANPAARQARIEVTARGTTYVAEREYPKGSPSPDPSTYMTDDELVAKFRRNVEGTIGDSAAAAVVEAVFSLEDIDDVSVIFDRLRPAGE